MVMDTSQGMKRLYWSGTGWVANPDKAHRSLEREWVDDCYFDLINAGCQAAVVLVEYSRINDRVTVYKVTEWDDFGVLLASERTRGKHEQRN